MAGARRWALPGSARAYTLSGQDFLSVFSHDPLGPSKYSPLGRSPQLWLRC